jgi:hypothetical protein
MRLWLVVGAGLWCVSTPLSAQVAVLGAIVVDSTDVSGNHIVVTAVADASPASYAGVAVGDRIVGVARRPVHRTSEIEQLAREQAGPVLLMLIQRDSVVTGALVPLHASAAELASPPRRVARGCAVFCLATTVADQATWDDCGCERAVRRTCNGCVAGWTERVPLWVVRHGPGLGPYEWRVHIRDAWCGQ